MNALFEKIADFVRDLPEQPHITSHLDAKHHVHIHNLVTFFAQGVLLADIWHKNYRVPPNLELVLNHISKRVQETFQCDVVELTMREVEALYRKWGAECPEYLAWNEWPGHPEGAINFTSAWTPIPEQRDFIDLDALIRNATVALRRDCEWITS